MSRFDVRQGVSAEFAERELGLAEQLDIGPFDDPDQLGLQYYIFNHHAQQDVIRFVAPHSVGDLKGRLGVLTLRRDGARYRVEALCAHEEPLNDGKFSLRFEAQGEPAVRASAKERHGVDDLAAALLLDALSDDP